MGVPACAVSGGFFFSWPQPAAAGKKKILCRGALHPWDRRGSVREFPQVGGAVLHTGSMPAMAVGGGAIGCLHPGGVCLLPHTCLPMSYEHYSVVHPTVSPQASQCTPVGACHAWWTARGSTLIQQGCVLASPQKPWDVVCGAPGKWAAPPPPARRRGGWCTAPTARGGGQVKWGGHHHQGGAPPPPSRPPWRAHC